MKDNDSGRGEPGHENPQVGERRQRRVDRRVDGGGMFGGYEGPERRSGRDRRASA